MNIMSLITYTAFLFAIVVGAKTTERKTIHKTFQIDSKCADSDRAWFYAPENYQDEVYPVLSWSHGMNGQVDKKWLSQLSSHGFIVVAAEGCQSGYVAAEHSANQLQTIAWVQKQAFEVGKVGVFGHSMGGKSTVISSLHHEEYNIHAAVLEMPAIYTTDSATPEVPTLFLAGAKDVLAPENTVLDWYKRTTEDKVILVGGNIGHMGNKKFENQVVNFFKCYLNGDEEMCAMFFGKDPEVCLDAFSTCLSSKFIPGQSEFEPAKPAVFKDLGNFMGFPCNMAVAMAHKTFGACPLQLEEACCASCHPEKEEMILSSARSCENQKGHLECELAAELMFAQYGSCPVSVAQNCCGSCSKFMLECHNSAAVSMPGWPWDLAYECRDDTSNCASLAQQASDLFGECPTFLKALCCESCQDSTPPADDYQYTYEEDLPADSPNTKPDNGLCPEGQKWNKCGDICPPQCKTSTFVFSCESNFCVPMCECTNGKFKDDNGECTFDPCDVWEDNGSIDIEPFPLPVNPKPVKPVGPVHPDHIPTHQPDPVTTADDYEEYIDNSQEYNEEECVNEDSSRDRRGNTCSDWYDSHPETCGDYDIGNHGFTARTQCCACYASARLSAKHSSESENTGQWANSWEIAAAAGILGGVVSALILMHCCRKTSTLEDDMGFDILLDDSKEFSSRT